MKNWESNSFLNKLETVQFFQGLSRASLFNGNIIVSQDSI